LFAAIPPIMQDSIEDGSGPRRRLNGASSLFARPAITPANANTGGERVKWEIDNRRKDRRNQSAI